MRFRLLVALLAFLVALVFLSGCLSEEPHYIYIAHKYQLEITTDTFIENATFLLQIGRAHV